MTYSPQGGPDQKRRKGHCFCWELRTKPYRACCGCGLVLLKNEMTQREVRKPCRGNG